MKYSLDGTKVTLEGGGHFIAPNAAVIGNVILKDRASVWFSCVLRGDSERIEVGAGSNIQDGTVMHADPGFPMVVGENVATCGFLRSTAPQDRLTRRRSTSLRAQSLIHI